ncbi:hypothetical protein D0869_12968 [Hortaea werneckii]|uniref:Glutamate-1-semialdehyde 2,1-aminomutase n=2 Tax=Hortaea werneckii TaxID=91943 RepID=A0A3M6W6G3_HORWE|nr:hypothetical protein D0869_12968 [Hortaea werneckii]RMY01099.1 hypothetical protein D0867_11510 [Hortaea werneckii]
MQRKMGADVLTPPPEADNSLDLAKLKLSDQGHEDNDCTAEEALATAQLLYVVSNPVSRELHEEAAKSLPGGNTRSLLHNAPFPIAIKRGTGSSLISEDGHTYTDLVGELTAGLFGHSNPLIHSTLKTALDNVGLSLGATTRLESQHARLMCDRFGLDRVRFTNSGTEANMHAIQAARRYTGKRKVVVFAGGYHGAVFCFASGAPAPNNVDLDDWVVAEFNNVSDARAKIEGTDGVAAVLVEGMQGAGPCIVGTDDFLQAVQASARKAGAVFILDEVMTSRLAPGGLQSLVGLKPDLTSFGKYLGGGITFGAFGGRLDIMAVYDPRVANSLAHSGTFNNNTLGMSAGYVGLSQIYTPEVAVAFNKVGDDLRGKLQDAAVGTKMTVTGRGSMLGIHFLKDGRKELLSVKERQGDVQLKELFWFEMLVDGFWITRRGSIALVMGTPQWELDRFVSCVKRFLVRHEKFAKI